MNREKFNRKYAKYIANGFYGAAIDAEEMLDYLDKEFETYLKENPHLQIFQIKMKFGYVRVYTNSSMDREWENFINTIILKK